MGTEKMQQLKGLYIIELSGNGCAGCHALLPQLNAVAEEFSLGFARFDVEETPEAVERFHAVRIPTILLAEDGVPFASCTGYQPEEILRLWTQAMLEDHAAGKI